MFAERDVTGMVSHMHEIIKWDDSLPDSPKRKIEVYKPRFGKAECAEFFTMLAENFDFHRFEVKNLMEGGNQVAALIDSEMTHKPTGNKIVDFQLHLFTYDDNMKLLSFEHYNDSAKWDILTRVKH
eukprot:NODE_71_length_24927_cov_1.205937.p21 type:complete len:126 gc:universal NODE_71_length_24927_cov_1.205937:3031-2654(-)